MDGRSGEEQRVAADHDSLLDAQRRIVAAFESLGTASRLIEERHARVEALEQGAAALERLRAEVAEERVANAQLAERVRVLRERAGADGAASDGVDPEALAGMAAERAAERAELDAVLAELIPIVEDLR